ncbi:MAG: hypothetical protein J1F35_06035 [Erysipelotrichales bacterium]|nr:hypothetical protein [Erysipelotrichales bacterium]
MEHIQDIYQKKPEYIKDLLLLDDIKINLKVDGKPFQVVYNDTTDEIEFHGRSGNETKVGPLITDYDRYFSKAINDAIKHIESRIDIFKKYKFLTFEVIDNTLLLTAVIKKNGDFVNSASEIKKISNELETDVMPTLWEGKLNQKQKYSLLNIIEENVPTKKDFIDFIKKLFDSYENFPKKLISASDEFIEGIVFFFNVDGKIVEYKLVDPSYRQSMKDRDNNNKLEREKNADKYEEIYNIFLDYVENNAEKLSDNRIHSIELNYLNMMKDSKIYNKLINLGANIKINNNERYTVQLDRTTPELAKAINKHGKVYTTLYELFYKLFSKPKKRGFVISKEFQNKVNDATELFEGFIRYENDLIFENNDEILKLKQLIRSQIKKVNLDKNLEFVLSATNSHKLELFRFDFETSDIDELKTKIKKYLNLNDKNEFIVGNKKYIVDIESGEYGIHGEASKQYNSLPIYFNDIEFFITNKRGNKSNYTRGAFEPNKFDICDDHKNWNLDKLYNYLIKFLEGEEGIKRFGAITNILIALINKIYNSPIIKTNDQKFVLDFEIGEYNDSTLNQISAEFGEVLTAIYYMKKYPGSLVRFPKDVNNPFCDFYSIEGKNEYPISIKSGSTIGHSMEISNILMGYSIDDPIIKSDKNLTEFYKASIKSPNKLYKREEILWNAAKIFLPLAVGKNEKYKEIWDFLTKNLDELNFNGVIKLYKKYLSKNPPEDLPIFVYNKPEKSPLTNKVDDKNLYSYVMHVLQLGVIAVLNQFKDTQDNFTKLVQRLFLDGKQSYCKITKKYINITTKSLDKLDKSVEFTAIGSTFNQYKEHGLLMFKIKK